MRLFADQCVPTDVVSALRALHLSVECAGEVGLAQASDTIIFEHACRTGRVLLTCDRDFGNVVRFNIRASAGVVIIDLEQTAKALVIARTQEFFRHISGRTLRGRLALIEPARVRLWPKPRV